MTYDDDLADVAPLTVSEPGDVNWSHQADIVVVGFGAAGVSASLEAIETGSVIAIDRFDGGGAAAYSGGLVYAGGGTSIQAEAGVEDSVDEMEKYLTLEVGGAVEAKTVRRYCEESVETIDWLQRWGVPFRGTLYTAKASYPPEGYFLFYSGNESVDSFGAQARPAPRGHRAVGSSFSGYAFYNPLKASALAAGVKLLAHSPVRRLVLDRAGRVLGVEVAQLPEKQRRDHQKLFSTVLPVRPFTAKAAVKADARSKRMEDCAPRVFVRALRGVVLSTGGFAYNPNMLARYAPLLARNVGAMLRMSSLGCTGIGVRLGASVGGATRGMDKMYVGRNMAPPAAFLKGILVNSEGRRFTNETGYNSVVGRAITEQPDGRVWLLLLRSDYRAALRELLTTGWSQFRYFAAPILLNCLLGGTRYAWSIRKMAGKLNVPRDNLEATVSEYSDRSRPDPFGKFQDCRTSLEGDGYVALNFSLANNFAFTHLFTLGGLDVNEETGQVLREDGGGIAGLYAAGRTAYGLCSHNYISGLSLGDSVFTGRRAARSILGSGIPTE